MNLKNEMVVYKIRDKNTGRFSTGGISPKWTMFGKAWNTRGSLKSHLTCWRDSNSYYGKKVEIPESWEVVEFKFELGETNVFSAREEAARPAKK